MALDPLYFAVGLSVPHGLGFDKGECAELTAAKDTLYSKKKVQVRCADRGNEATPYLAHLFGGVTLHKRKPEEWGGVGVETGTNVLHVVETFFLAQLCVATFGTNLFTGMIRFMATSLVGAEKVQWSLTEL